MSSRLLWLRLCREHYEYAPDSYKDRFLPSKFVGSLVGPTKPQVAQPPAPDEFDLSWRPPNIADIKRVVCRHYKITAADIISARRDPASVMPRQIAIYLSRKLTPRSMPEIGRWFCRDHTTVLHSVRKVDKLMLTDEEVAAVVVKLQGALRNKSMQGERV